MKKTWKYLGIIVLLLAVNLILLNRNSGSKSASFDDRLFAIEDTASVSSVVLKGNDITIDLSRTNGSWVVNGQAADQNFVRVLLSILKNVRVKRTIGNLDTDNVGDVSIAFNDGETIGFEYTSDANATKTYFIRNAEGYQVEVPGYRDNVSNILELHPDQWKSRLVFDASWRTIQRLNVRGYGAGLDIQFANQFFNISGVNQIDSSAVVDYLNQWQLFQANEMISSGRFKNFDSLKSTNPIAEIEIEDISSRTPTRFAIYPNLDNQPFHLVVKNENEMMVIDAQRIQNLLRTSQDFEAR